MTDAVEEWRPWRAGDYEVSSLGRVRRARPGRRTFVGRMMALYRMKIGYLTVNPVVNGKNVPTYVHAMVAECFIGPRPPDADINHLDGDKTNNVVANLEYDCCQRFPTIARGTDGAHVIVCQTRAWVTLSVPHQASAACVRHVGRVRAVSALATASGSRRRR